MDWLDSMAMYAQDRSTNEEQDAEEEDEDFYGYSHGVNSSTTAGDALPGAPNASDQVNVAQYANGTAMPNSNFLTTPGNSYDNYTTHKKISAEEQKVENQRKAEQLRAKLMAQRQNTPVKQLSRANTPAKPSSAAPQPKNISESADDEKQKLPSSDVYNLETLLAEGKAAAEAEMRQQNTAPILSQTEQAELTTTTLQPSNNILPVKPPQAEIEKAEMTMPSPEQASKPTSLVHPYYADLSIWLELTGYHDVEYRDSKLHTFKERKALEAEAARIQERLDKLRQDETTSAQALRNAPAHPTSAPTAAPPMPDTLPTGDTVRTLVSPTLTTNGTKRAHSPEPNQPTKARRDDTTDGFRIRGANDSPEGRAPQTRERPRGRSPHANAGLERRISYGNGRRLSEDFNARTAFKQEEERDASLERRQSYYKRESDTPAFNRNRQDHHFSRDASKTSYNARSRMNFHAFDARVDHSGAYREPPHHYRGSAALSLRKGGVRYFMIKSWNHDNVATAMRDGLWATQEKNQQLLTEAYKTSRHVLLLFSVNKSTAFQGYAIMASPPDPSLPKPPFCAKLNWGTSPAFKLRWLATTSVHFRHVGHLKNPLNLDDDGKPMAVLVGKDGQEISPEAGMGVVEILDEAEEADASRRRSGGNGRPY